MAHAYYHAKSSARKFGGVWEDYMKLHEFMDHTKAHIPDNRYRMVLHNSWGIFFVEKIFGALWTRASDGKQVPTRAILEQHVLEDLRTIPTLEQCFAQMPVEGWQFQNALPLSQQESEEKDDTYIEADSTTIRRISSIGSMDDSA